MIKASPEQVQVTPRSCPPQKPRSSEEQSSLAMVRLPLRPGRS
jgi:hypothetical protein